MPRIQSRVTFPMRNLEEAMRILEPLGAKPETRPGIDIHSATLFVDQDEYQSLIRELMRRNLHYSETKSLCFSQEEFDKSRFFLMRPAGYWGFPLPDDDFLKESYDVSDSCGLCGKGVVQTKPFLVKGPARFGRNDILALNRAFEFVVTQRLQLMIERNGLTGSSFWPLLNFKNRKPLSGYCQLHVEHPLLPMAKTTEFEIIECNGICRCPHPILNLEYHQIRYRKEDLADAMDFNLTCEWLGGGWFGQTRWKVVSAKEIGRAHV